MWTVEETYGGYKIVRDGIYDLLCDGAPVTFADKINADIVAWALTAAWQGT